MCVHKKFRLFIKKVQKKDWAKIIGAIAGLLAITAFFINYLPCIINKHSDKNVEIIMLLPHPIENERMNEAATIKNNSKKTVSLKGWKLIDEKNNTWLLDELNSLAPNEEKTILRNRQTMGLNNNADEVRLLDNDNNEIDKVKYTSATEGKEIFF